VRRLRGERSPAAVAAAAAGFVAAEVDGFAPCNVGPTPSWHLEDCRLPFQQKPSEPCMAVYRHSGKFAAYPALFSVAPDVEILVESSPLPASSCLLLLLHVASYAWLPRLPAIAVEVLGVGPSADLTEEVEPKEGGGPEEAAIRPCLPEGADRDEESTSADGSTCYLVGEEGMRDPHSSARGRNGTWKAALVASNHGKT
jgi:hypothetical protein